MLIALRKILRNYLIVRSNILGITIKVIFIEIRIASADKIPNKIVGLKFDRIRIKNPKMIVNPVIKIALPVSSNVFFSLRVNASEVAFFF